MSALVQIRPRPSAAAQWAGGGCTGSPSWKATYPRESGPAAKEGNRLHDVAAGILKGHATRLDEDLEAIDLYIRNVLDAVAAVEGNHRLDVEVKLEWLRDRGLQGTPDAVLYDYDRKHAIIWDLKTGRGLVEAIGNWQLAAYAMMLPDRGPGWSVEMRIVQPRAYHPHGPVRVWAPTEKEFEPFHNRIIAKYQEAMSPSAKLVTGEHCRYCDAIAACPSARKLSLHVVEWSDSEPHDLPDDHIGREIHLLRSAEQALKHRLAGLEALALAKLQSGAQLPDVSIEHGRGSVSWADETSARFTLQLLTGKDQTVATLPTPKQLIKSGVDPAVVHPLTTHKPGKVKIEVDLDGAKLKTLLPDLDPAPAKATTP